MTDYRLQIIQFLTTASGSAADVYFELYGMLCRFDPQTQLKALRFVCEGYKIMQSDGSRFISTELYTGKQAEYAEKLVDARFMPRLKQIIDSCVAKKVTADYFYSAVWSEIRNSKLLASKLERAIALYKLVYTAQYPYSCLFTPEENWELYPGNKLNERICAIFENSSASAVWKETEEIVSTKIDFPMLTQELLLDKFNTLQTRDEKIAFLYIIMLAAHENPNCVISR